MVSKKKNRAYGLGSPLQDVFPEPVKAQRAPTTNDIGYEIGQIWVDQSSSEIYGMSSIASGSATWSILGPPLPAVSTLTGDTGGAISTVNRNINIIGGDRISVSGADNTLTINIDETSEFFGRVTLVAGTVIVPKTLISSGDHIFLSREGAGASLALGMLSVSIIDAESFTITSLDATAPGTVEILDISIVNYSIIKQN